MHSTLRFSSASLRPLAIEDADMLLAWRNDPRVRGAMFHSHVITRQEHFAWLDRILDQSPCVYFIFELDGEPTGVVGFKIDEENLKGEWTFHIRPDGAPKGAGAAMGFLAVDYFFDSLGMRKLIGEVLGNNQKSLGMHLKLGFIEEGVRRAHVLKDGCWQDVYEVAIFREIWERRRASLRNSLFAPIPG